MYKNPSDQNVQTLLLTGVCFAFVVTEAAVISLEADLPLNSGNCEDEDLVERPLRFAAAHKPPLPEVLECREPEKRLVCILNICLLLEIFLKIFVAFSDKIWHMLLLLANATAA